MAPAVVSVNVLRRERTLPRTMFDAFMVPRGYEQLVEGLGTGFLITTDGFIVTNQHVVTGAEQIVVTLRDGRDFQAHLVGEDARTDVALLRIDTTGLPVAPIGRASQLQLGDWVVAIGNPYGYLLGNSEPSISAGVVSGLSRDILTQTTQGDRGGLYVDMIQTDAAINPGNSGGPLVNADGEVVGVNAFILSQSGGSIGLGFAIPIERAMRIATDLRLRGRVRRGWIGVEIAEPQSRSGSWRRQAGVQVRRVALGGPGEQARIKVGETIEQVNGRPIRNFLNWEKALIDVTPGDTLRIGVHRGGRIQEVLLVATELPSERAVRVSFADLQLITVTSQIQAERRLQYPRGALVTRAGPESQRALGVQEGDVILQINNYPISDAAQVTQVLEYLRGRGMARLYVERDGQIVVSDVWPGAR
ncbi:MAG TPA: trypsin-like peptidase domain-containing protein [Gemmatimonadales bacterium]|nr:trypsin-like peptidase domain-containing protein [Gemmatimonadales bacterium]